MAITTAAKCTEQIFIRSDSPGALWEYLYSDTDATWLASCSWWSWGTGEPSLLRHSGVCRPLEGGERSPWCVGDAGALLYRKRTGKLRKYYRKCIKLCILITVTFLTPSNCQYVLPSAINLLCSIQSNDSQEQKQREGRELTVWQCPTCTTEDAGKPLTWRREVRTASWNKPPLAAVFSWRLVPPVCSLKQNPDAKNSPFQARPESGPLSGSSGWARGCVWWSSAKYKTSNMALFF